MKRFLKKVLSRFEKARDKVLDWFDKVRNKRLARSEEMRNITQDQFKKERRNKLLNIACIIIGIMTAIVEFFILKPYGHWAEALGFALYLGIVATGLMFVALICVPEILRSKHDLFEKARNITRNQFKKERRNKLLNIACIIIGIMTAIIVFFILKPYWHWAEALGIALYLGIVATVLMFEAGIWALALKSKHKK